MAPHISPDVSRSQWWKWLGLVICPLGKEKARRSRVPSLPSDHFHPGLAARELNASIWVQIEVWTGENLIPDRNHISDFCLGANLSSWHLEIWWKFAGQWFCRAYQNHLYSLRNIQALVSTSDPWDQSFWKGYVWHTVLFCCWFLNHKMIWYPF